MSTIGRCLRRSRGALYTLGRKLLPAGRGIAHKYEITDAEDNTVGSIEGEFALSDFDQYEVTLTETSSYCWLQLREDFRHPGVSKSVT